MERLTWRARPTWLRLAIGLAVAAALAALTIWLVRYGGEPVDINNLH